MPIRFLQSPEAWGQLGLDGSRVETLQTRRSWIFLTRDHVLKLKKPVKDGPVDFSTPALRGQACREELRINQRLAAGVYLCVVALLREPAGWVLEREATASQAPASARDGPVKTAEPPGRGVHPRPSASDWLVLMRRLPRQRMLDRLLAGGAVGSAQADALARRLATFWRDAPRASVPCRSLLARAEQELQSSLDLIGHPRWGWPEAAPVLARSARVLRAGRPLIARRIAEGRIVEGHGDLRPEHICLPQRGTPALARASRQGEVPSTVPPVHQADHRIGDDGTPWPDDLPLVIDALEFDPTLRAVDPFDELAYLALECRQQGAPGFGLRVLARCACALDDAPGHELLRVYTGQRALLRARLALAHLLDPVVREPSRWRPLAAWYLRCADAALQPLGQPKPRASRG